MKCLIVIYVYHLYTTIDASFTLTHRIHLLILDQDSRFKNVFSKKKKKKKDYPLFSM